MLELSQTELHFPEVNTFYMSQENISETFEGTTHTVDLRQNEDGIYIFEVRFSDKSYSQKVLKH